MMKHALGGWLYWALLWGPVWTLLCSVCQASEPPRLSADSYQLRTETLSPAEMQDLYLKLIENFIGWAEDSGRFVSSESLEPSGGYFRAAGKGVAWPRGNGNLCISYALLLSELPDRQHFSRHEISRQVLLDHMRRSIRSVCLANKNCTRYVRTKHAWGGPAWQSALDCIGVTWAAHLCEDMLDADTLALVREVAGKEADLLDKKLPSNRFNNTGAEDGCWNTAFLCIVANKYSEDPRAEHWDYLAKKWAYNAISTPRDSQEEGVVDGKPLKEWVECENVHPDLTIENHGMWSVGYQCTQQHFGEALLAYRLFDKQAPDALSHHADDMWRDVTSKLYLWDGDLLFPHGQDWSWKTYASIPYLAWQHCCRGNAAAGALESRAVQAIYRRQLSLGTGDLGAAHAPTLNFGNQTVKPKRWAFCYLMHKYFEEPQPISAAKAHLAAQGVSIYPHTRTAIHRAPTKCVSVAWDDRYQPVFVLPEGESTYVDPPFYLPYDRQTCVTRVRVRVDSPSSRKARRATAPRLDEAVAMEGGRAMRVRYHRRFPHGVTQHTAVVSLPDEATLYCTAFHAEQPAVVTLGRVFPLRADAPPGFKRPVKQLRGANWVNLSDHAGFVSLKSLPKKLPADKFWLADPKKFRVKSGEWFGRSVLVVYARQPASVTESLASKLQLLKDAPGSFVLRVVSSSGERQIEIDFQ